MHECMIVSAISVGDQPEKAMPRTKGGGSLVTRPMARNFGEVVCGLTMPKEQPHQ